MKKSLVCCVNLVWCNAPLASPPQNSYAEIVSTHTNLQQYFLCFCEDCQLATSNNKSINNSPIENDKFNPCMYAVLPTVVHRIDWQPVLMPNHVCPPPTPLCRHAVCCYVLCSKEGRRGCYQASSGVTTPSSPAAHTQGHPGNQCCSMHSACTGRTFHTKWRSGICLCAEFQRLPLIRLAVVRLLKTNRSFQGGQKTRFLRNPNFHYGVHRVPPNVPVLSQMNPVHTPKSYLFTNVILHRPCILSLT